MELSRKTKEAGKGDEGRESRKERRVIVCPPQSGRGKVLAPEGLANITGISTHFQTRVKKEKAKKLATERALDKYELFVFGLTIGKNLY